jgi:hypothetical protein
LRDDPFQRGDLGKWLYGPVWISPRAQTVERQAELDDILARLADDELMTDVLRRGLAKHRRTHLGGSNARVYLQLRHLRDRLPAGAPAACEGDDAGPGCGLVFDSTVWMAKRCPRCNGHGDTASGAISFKPLPRDFVRWVDFWDTSCRRLEYGRCCEHCGAGFWTTDTRRVYCADTCKVAAHRARAA